MQSMYIALWEWNKIKMLIEISINDKMHFSLRSQISKEKLIHFINLKSNHFKTKKFNWNLELISLYFWIERKMIWTFEIKRAIIYCFKKCIKFKQNDMKVISKFNDFWIKNRIRFISISMNEWVNIMYTVHNIAIRYTFRTENQFQLFRFNIHYILTIIISNLFTTRIKSNFHLLANWYWSSKQDLNQGNMI